jgi:hypothetical protein
MKNRVKLDIYKFLEWEIQKNLKQIEPFKKFF